MVSKYLSWSVPFATSVVPGSRGVDADEHDYFDEGLSVTKT